jgi:Zn-dependent protease
VGSFLVPVVLYNLTGGAMFGWAKPVPINPNNFHSYRSADIKVSLAGIVANLLLAAAFTVLIVALLNIKRVTGFESFVDLMVGVAWYGVQINLILAFFNLIPIPPLDGSHVIYHFIPAKWQSSYDRLGQYGLILIIACVILVPGLFEFILTPVFKLLEVADSFIRLMS